MNSANFQKLAAEFLVIVVGVLVALAVDQWRDDRNEKALEVAYASRLTGDLHIDTANYGDLLRGAYKDKRDVLLALSKSQLPEADDADEMLALLDRSTWFGIIEPRAAAFREMESSGRLGLLSSSVTRDALANYYARHAFLAEVFDSSPGGYRLLIYETVPGAAWYTYEIGQPIDEALVSAGTTALLEDSRLAGAVNAELAYLGGLVQRYEALRRDAVALIHRLEADYPAEGSF